MFFKTKIKPGDFANCLVRDHRGIFGLKNLEEICKQFDLHFRDEPSYIQAFYELQAFGLYSIACGVRTHCGQDFRRVILTSLNERFADICGRNWAMFCHRVTEYEEFGDRAPAGELAAKLIFEQPGVVQSDSREAFGLTLIMNEC